MEQFIVDQIKYGLKYLPGNLLKSFFIPDSNEETKKLREKGFICGVCHPTENFQQIREGNIGWIRIDIPFPYDESGNIRECYNDFKAKCKRFQDNGIKVMAVTPYPDSYLPFGADIRTDEGTEKVREIARFLVTDMQGYASAFQITNEMGMPIFTQPFTMDEAVKFIAVNLEEMYPLRGDILIGYNSAGPQADLHSKLLPYVKYCDYVGIDIYIGCFANVGGFMNFFDAMVRYLWALTGKPVIIQEFGYMSGGVPKTKKEKQDILKSYGFSNEAHVKMNIAEFVDRLPKRFGDHVKRICEGNESRYFDFIFKSDMNNHLYRDMPRVTKIPGYSHSPEGQAKFYRDIFARLYKKPYVCGAIIYCYSDSDICYVCGQSDCPIETRWGLVDCNGVPKPSYYEVQKTFAKINK